MNPRWYKELTIMHSRYYEQVTSLFNRPFIAKVIMEDLFTQHSNHIGTLDCLILVELCSNAFDIHQIYNSANTTKPDGEQVNNT